MKTYRWMLLLFCFAAMPAFAQKARGLAGDARAHVREMHKAAMKGDADGARTHAGLALPFVYQLIDWSS